MFFLKIEATNYHNLSLFSFRSVNFLNNCMMLGNFYFHRFHCLEYSDNHTSSWTTNASAQRKLLSNAQDAFKFFFSFCKLLVQLFYHLKKSLLKRLGMGMFLWGKHNIFNSHGSSFPILVYTVKVSAKFL